MKRITQSLSRLWVVLTLIWWAALLAVLLPGGVSFEFPKRVIQNQEAEDYYNKFCRSQPAPRKEVEAKCWQIVIEQEQANEKKAAETLAAHYFVSFEQRAELVGEFIGPPLLVDALGAALVWVCRPLAKGASR